MIINPIIPIWLMSIICGILIILILFNKNLKNSILNRNKNEITVRQKSLIKHHIVNSIIKICIVIVLFVINLRFMIPNGESTTYKSNFNVLFVVDKSYSMRALDYDGNKERWEGVIKDCTYIIEQLSSCKFSIITFGDEAQRVIPFTTDVDMAQAQINTMVLEDDFYAEGTTINIVKEELEKTVKENSNVIVFFITDGEITKEGEKLESFASISDYIVDGAVMGYGTTTGGKMVDKTYEDDPSNSNYYKYYYDDNYKRVTALSKIDESNLKKLSSDLGIDYIQMSKTSNINYKINDIKKKAEDSQKTEDKISSYDDIYYYFAIPLVILLIIDFIIQKRRM